MMESIFSTNWTTTFKLMRLMDKRLQPVTFDISIDLEIEDASQDSDQVQYIDKMKMWVETILNNCIAFNVYNDCIETDFLGKLDNHIMFCPDDPNDYLIFLLVVAKLNAIGNDVVSIKSASINGDVSVGFGYSILGNSLEMLPSAEEWMGKVRYYDQPWWNRGDGCMMDIPVNEGEDPNKKPDILIELGPTEVQIETEVQDGDSRSAEIIKLNFKPKKND